MMTDFEIQRCGRKDQCETEIEQLLTQLAAAQAVIEQMQEVFIHIAAYWNGHDNPRATLDACYHNIETSNVALAIPTDNTALRDRLRQERERCAKVCDKIAEDVTYQRDSQGAAERCAAKIRSMEDE